MGGEHVDVRPVLGELLLELRDLGLARSDLALDARERGRARLRRRLRLRLRLHALDRQLGLRARFPLLACA